MVRDQNERRAVGLELAQRRCECARPHFVEARVRFVEQQQPWAMHERPRDRHALLQSTTEQTELRVRTISNAQTHQYICCRRIGVLHPLALCREPHVLAYRQCSIEHRVV